MIDWFGRIASKRGVPDGWRWFKAEAKGEPPHTVFLITGAVPNGTVSRGKHKGRPKYDQTTKREIAISRSDMDAEQATYERETGNCHDCEGSGKTVASAHMNGEKTYRDCRSCGATGKASTP